MDYSLVRESIRLRVESNNEKAKTALIKQLRSPLGVIPFLGAGISAPLKYRQWGEFLGGTAREQLGGAQKAAVEEAVAREDYFRAAALLSESIGERDFQRSISEEFSDDRLQTANLRAGALGYLPLLTAGPVITTNFDRVIEHVFERQGRVLEKVYGANPDQVVPAIQQNRLMLWKIHGDRDDPRTRVFSEAEYRKHYRLLPGLLLVAFLNRPALFLGCSLDKDRTTEVLQDIGKKHPANTHFAILQIPESDEEFDSRTADLRRIGVRPIWYRKGEYREIEDHLSDLVQGISAVRLNEAEKHDGQTMPPMTPEMAAHVLEVELGEVATGLQIQMRLDPASAPEDPPYLPILEKMTRGKIAFFLGSYACLGRLPLGPEFYDDLVAKLGETDMSGRMQPTRIAQHYADKHGRDALYLLVNQKLGTMRPSPTIVHRFIATLTDRLQAGGLGATSRLIFTTNYDDWMEYTLNTAGVRYHLFTYRVDDPHAGHFIYQSPSGSVHLIDRPSHFRRLPEDCTVVVKLHGGLHRSIDLPISYAFMHRDFVELAGKMHSALPQVILDLLQGRSLLFLGSGLGDDSIESLVRAVQSADPKKLSWAVQWRSRPEKRLYWNTLGVELSTSAWSSSCSVWTRRSGFLPGQNLQRLEELGKRSFVPEEPKVSRKLSQPHSNDAKLTVHSTGINGHALRRLSV